MKDIEASGLLSGINVRHSKLYHVEILCLCMKISDSSLSRHLQHSCHSAFKDLVCYVIHSSDKTLIMQ
jgi:hypothetical protein